MSLIPNISIGSLGTSSLLGGKTAVGTNPLNPLQGQSALSGIGDFIKGIETKAAQRKAGLLPSTKKTAPGAAALTAGGAAGVGGLEALLGQLMQQLQVLLSAQAAK